MKANKATLRGIAMRGKCVECPKCQHYNSGGTMRCYCGHFFHQMGGSTTPSVPDNRRLVIISGNQVSPQIGWFDAASGWWFTISQERVNGDPMPPGEWCSLDIGNITEWREIPSK